MQLERLGIPGAFVASTEFEHAAAAQARALGFLPLAVYLPHPIQDRTDQEMTALADAAAERLVAALAERT